MFLLKTKHRNRPQIRHQYSVERLEGRLMLAGDMNIGSYVLDGGSVKTDDCETDSGASYRVEDHGIGLDVLDDQPVEEKVVDPPPEQPGTDIEIPVDPSDSSTELEAEEDENDQQVKFGQNQFSDAHEGSSGDQADEFASGESPLIVLPVVTPHTNKKVALAKTDLTTLADTDELDRFHYFAGREESERDEPDDVNEASLTRESLGDHVRRDTFVAMSLLEPRDLSIRETAQQTRTRSVVAERTKEFDESSEPSLEAIHRDLAASDQIFGEQGRVDDWAVASALDHALTELAPDLIPIGGDVPMPIGAEGAVVSNVSANIDVCSVLDERSLSSPGEVPGRHSGVQFAAFIFVSTILTQRGGFFQARGNAGRPADPASPKHSEKT